MNDQSLELLYESLLSEPKSPEHVISHYISKVQGNIASARASLEIIKHQFEVNYPEQSPILVGAVNKYVAQLQEMAEGVEKHISRYFSFK